MVALPELVAYCNSLLKVERFNDYCPNGLQVEGRAEVRRLVSGVTASQALLEQALAAGADAILVHHGYFWKGEPATVTGMRRRRLQLLLGHDISLLAFHLPLDAHPELGNNASLAGRLGLLVDGVAPDGRAKDILFYGRLPAPLALQDFAQQVAQSLGHTPLTVAGGEHTIQRLAWCSGGAQGFIDEAAALGVDAYLSGEISEQTTHSARENGIHYIAAGHHATERFGPAALGEHLAQRFDLFHQFVDIENPA